MSAALSMPEGYYNALHRLTHEVSGIALGDDYKFMIETRLSSLARTEGFPGLIEMVQALFKSGDSRLAVKVVAEIMQRDTHFFTNKAGLATLSDKLLPHLYQKFGTQAVNLLILGINSGQEAYSTAIVIDKFKQSHPDFNVQIMAADYASQALERARSGRYSHFDVQRGLPIQDLVDYFGPVGEDWAVSDKLRDMINFQELHLLKLPQRLGMFHVIICRNVIHRMHKKIQTNFIRNLMGHAEKGGYLLVGDKETLPQTAHLWAQSDLADHLFTKTQTRPEIEKEDAQAREARRLIAPKPETFLGNS